MSAYRARYFVLAGDHGRPLGKVGLEPVAKNVQGHVKARLEDWGYGWAYVRVGSNLGQACLIVEADSAHAVRVADRTIRAFLDNTGWAWRARKTAAWTRAL